MTVNDSLWYTRGGKLTSKHLLHTVLVVGVQCWTTPDPSSHFLQGNTEKKEGAVVIIFSTLTDSVLH